MNRLDVLFVIPTNVLDIKGGVTDAIEPPARARLMAAYLMRRNCSVDLFDSNVLDWSPEKMAQEVKTVNPHLVVVPVYGYNPSASTQTMPSAREFAQAIRNESPNTTIMFTGTHPAALPGKTLLDEPIDYICGGEGPITTHELLQAIKGGNGIQNVRGLWYRENGRAIPNAPAPLIDLNDEPAMDAWHLMDPRKYRPHHWQRFYLESEASEPYANPFSVEGCPFQCNFCNIHSTFRQGEGLRVEQGLARPGVNSYRFLKPELFVKEVEYLVKEYGVKYFKIPDEMFGLNPNHVLTIARLIKERFGNSLNIWCYFRIDTCNPKFLEPLASAGFTYLGLGIEAANSQVRSGIGKGFKDEKIFKVLEEIESVGLMGGNNFIFGLEGDTAESIQATYKMACELNGHYGNFYCRQALPGSKDYETARRIDYPLPERLSGPGWFGHAQYSEVSEPYYEGRDLTPAQILDFRDRAHIAYYRRPEYLDKIRKDPRFGEIAVQHVLEWISHLERNLKRKLVEDAKASGSFAPIPLQ